MDRVQKQNSFFSILLYRFPLQGRTSGLVLAVCEGKPGDPEAKEFLQSCQWSVAGPPFRKCHQMRKVMSPTKNFAVLWVCTPSTWKSLLASLLPKFQSLFQMQMRLWQQRQLRLNQQVSQTPMESGPSQFDASNSAGPPSSHLSSASVDVVVDWR